MLSDLDFLESNLNFSIFAFDQFALIISDNWIFDNTIIVWWKLDHIGGGLDDLFIFLLNKVDWADSDSGCVSILILDVNILIES